MMFRVRAIADGRDEVETEEVFRVMFRVGASHAVADANDVFIRILDPR